MIPAWDVLGPESLALCKNEWTALMTPIIFLAAAFVLAMSIAIWCCLRHGARFDLGCMDDCEHPVSVPYRVRVIESRRDFTRWVDREFYSEMGCDHG